MCWRASKSMCFWERAGQMLDCPLCLTTWSHVAPLHRILCLPKSAQIHGGSRSISQSSSPQAHSYYVVRRAHGLGHWLMLDLLLHFPVPFGVQFVSCGACFCRELGFILLNPARSLLHLPLLSSFQNFINTWCHRLPCFLCCELCLFSFTLVGFWDEGTLRTCHWCIFNLNSICCIFFPFAIFLLMFIIYFFLSFLISLARNLWIPLVFFLN